MRANKQSCSHAVLHLLVVLSRLFTQATPPQYGSMVGYGSKHFDLPIPTATILHYYPAQAVPYACCALAATMAFHSIHNPMTDVAQSGPEAAHGSATLPPRRRRGQYHYELRLFQRQPYSARTAAALKDSKGRQHELGDTLAPRGCCRPPRQPPIPTAAANPPPRPSGGHRHHHHSDLPGTKNYGTRAVFIPKRYSESGSRSCRQDALLQALNHDVAPPAPQRVRP